MELQIGRWGNSLALRLPALVARKMRLQEGAKVELTVDEIGNATLKPAASFDQKAWLAGVRALTRGMPISEEVVRQMRDEARY